MIKKIKTPKKSTKKNVLFTTPTDPNMKGITPEQIFKQHPITKFMKNIFGSGQSVNTSESLTAGPKGFRKRKR